MTIKKSFSGAEKTIPFTALFSYKRRETIDSLEKSVCVTIGKKIWFEKYTVKLNIECPIKNCAVSIFQISSLLSS
jgi:hypothetical protein